MNCDWEITDEPGRYRCLRCGFLMPAAQPHPPDKVIRDCDVIDLGGQNTPRMPPHAKAWNLTKAIASWASCGFERVSKQEYADRLKVCDGCEHRSGNWCSACGCRLTVKALAPSWHCPLGKWSGDPEPDPEVAKRLARHESRQDKSMLIGFPHGFGDAVQLTTVLLHLRRLYPGWSIDVACKRGAESLFYGLCRRVLTLGDDQIDQGAYTISKTLPWWEPDQCYADSPGTKAEHCLHRTFGIEPIEELCRYTVAPTDDATTRAVSYIESLPCDRRSDGRWRVILLHYQGNSARMHKNLDEQTVRCVIEVARSRGLLPVVLDWETPHRSRLIDQRTVFCPDVDNPIWQRRGTGDGAALFALISLSSLMIGIDSGPEHVAGATSTPTLIAWRRHHPYHYFGLAENVTHLVPRNHERFLRGDRDLGAEYFRRKYRYRTCDKHLRLELPEAVDAFISEHVESAA